MGTHYCVVSCVLRSLDSLLFLLSLSFLMFIEHLRFLVVFSRRHREKYILLHAPRNRSHQNLFEEVPHSPVTKILVQPSPALFSWTWVSQCPRFQNKRTYLIIHSFIHESLSHATYPIRQNQKQWTGQIPCGYNRKKDRKDRKKEEG